jgi:hypothetical protein
MPLSRVVIRIIMEMIYDNNNDRDDAACRKGTQQFGWVDLPLS